MAQAILRWPGSAYGPEHNRMKVTTLISATAPIIIIFTQSSECFSWSWLNSQIYLRSASVQFCRLLFSGFEVAIVAEWASVDLVWRWRTRQTIIMYILGGGIKLGSTSHTNMPYLFPELPLYLGSAISRGPSPNLRGWERHRTYPYTQKHIRKYSLYYTTTKSYPTANPGYTLYLGMYLKQIKM